jgi:hypothetical protein
MSQSVFDAARNPIISDLIPCVVEVNWMCNLMNVAPESGIGPYKSFCYVPRQKYYTMLQATAIPQQIVSFTSSAPRRIVLSMS